MKKIVLIFVLCFLAGCVDDPTPGLRKAGEQVPVRMNMVVHKDTSSQTRSIAAAQENAIQTVDILAFQISGTSETFIYSAIGSITAGDTTPTQSLTAQLQIQPYQQRIVVIANAHAQVGTLLGSSNEWVGTNKATMLAKLEMNLASGEDRWDANSSSDFTAIPMWGESAAESITSTSTGLSADIYLMRMVARIDVQLDTTVSGLTSSFKLKSANLYNTNTGGLVVPTAANVTTTTDSSGNPYLSVSAPSIPTELQPYTARHLGPITYSDFTAPGVTDVSIQGAIYTFETAAVTDDMQATYMVIGGIYGTDASATYYRVDFFAAGTTNRIPILRNYKYTVNISSVHGSGHATADEAASSKSVNMTFDILSWNQTSMGNIAFDGENTLAVSKNAISLSSDAYTAAWTSTSILNDNTLTVFTDYTALSTSDTSGWTVQKIVNASGGAITWLNISPTTGAANATTNCYITATQNTTGAARTGIIWLQAGRLLYPVSVTQSIYPAMSLSIVDSSGNPITNLVWSSAAGATPSTQSFTVKGVPSTLDFNIVSTQISDTADFPGPWSNPSVNDGAPTTGTLTGGTTTYTITPPALTSTELAANPFLQKSSRLDFTITNGNTSITRSITLTQLNYNITTNLGNAPYNYFVLNGGAYSFNVRSNGGWSVKNIAQTPVRTATPTAVSMLNNATTDNLKVGTTGGYKTTYGGGDKLTFTANTKGYWGPIDVTFTNTNSPSRYADYTQRFYMFANQLSVYGLGTGDNRYNVWTSSSNGNFSMMATGANFGGTIGTSKVLMATATGSSSGLNIGGTLASAGTLTTSQINAIPAATDVIFLCAANWANDVASLLYTNFLAKGKTVVAFCEDGNSIHYLLNNALGTSATSSMYFVSTNNKNGACYQFSANSTDPIVNNVFGSLSNGYWGNDGASGLAIWGLTSSNAVIYSNANDNSDASGAVPSGLPSGSTMQNGVTAFRLTSCNLIVFCDGGFAGNNGTSDTNSTLWPCRTDASSLPVAKTGYGNGSTKQSVSNSIAIANILAWAAAKNM